MADHAAPLPSRRGLLQARCALLLAFFAAALALAPGPAPCAAQPGVQFYDALCPYWQNDKIETRKAEPYSYCQFIMGRDHSAFGRARHPFMTGTGGWALRGETK